MSYLECCIECFERLFPYLNEDYLVCLLNKNNSSFTETFRFLESKIKTTIKWVKSKSKYRYDRKSKLMPGVTLFQSYRDEMANFKVKHLSNLIDKKVTELKIPRFNQQLALEVVDIAEKYVSLNTVKCECCDDNFEIDEMISCTNAHIFCKSCFIKYVETIVFSNGKHEIPCMCSTEECDGIYQESLLYNVLPSKLYETLEVNRINSSSIKSIIPGLVTCRKCMTSYIVEDEIFLYCSECNIKTCRYCNDEDHENMSCQEFKEKKDEDLKSDSIRLKVEESITDALLRKCPTCSKAIIKEDGCNKIRCSCKTLFCYICNLQVNSYDHFCGCSNKVGCKRCHLFDDPDAKDLKKINDLSEKMLKDEPEYSKEIGKTIFNNLTTKSSKKKKIPNITPWAEIYREDNISETDGA